MGPAAPGGRTGERVLLAADGSCSVLGRTVKAIAQDIGGWLKAPRDGANLGQ